MGPRDKTNSVRKQSRPAPLPECTFLRGGIRILHCSLARYVIGADVGNGQLFLSVRASLPLLSTNRAMERLLSQKQGAFSVFEPYCGSSRPISPVTTLPQHKDAITFGRALQTLLLKDQGTQRLINARRFRTTRPHNSVSRRCRHLASNPTHKSDHEARRFLWYPLRQDLGKDFLF